MTLTLKVSLGEATRKGGFSTLDRNYDWSIIRSMNKYPQNNLILLTPRGVELIGVDACSVLSLFEFVNL